MNVAHNTQATIPAYLWHPVELGKGVRIRDESQTRPAPDHVLDISPEFVSEVAKDAEDGESGKQRCQCVCQADDPGISARRKSILRMMSCDVVDEE